MYPTMFFFLQNYILLRKTINYEQHKGKLIEKKFLLNSFNKCEEYINET